MAPNKQRRAAAKVRPNLARSCGSYLTRRLAVTQFYQEDIVQRKDDPKAYGVVLVRPLRPLSQHTCNGALNHQYRDVGRMQKTSRRHPIALTL